jgi:carboxylesterase type B
MCACHRCYSPQQEISQEDCLSVNIAVRKEALESSEGVPIIYYLHGGGGNHGHNRYDAYELVTKENMMVISIGYRLGMFAFLYLPEIEDGQDYQSNFGIMDQISAMRFSQKYAAIFGGNPSEAVVSGSSSAGEAVWWLLTIPEAWPYFNKANIMCMGVNNANRPETATLARQVVLETMNCETIDCLRKFTREEIRDAANIAAGTSRHSSTKISLEPGFAPVVDGKFLRDHLFTLVANGDIRPNTPISFSYNDHDQWEFNHLSIFTLKNKFLRDEIPAFNKIVEDSHHSLQVPSDYSDLLLERYFGAEAAAELKTVFGCSSETTVIECNVQFDRFLTSYGWNCNSRKALEHLQGVSGLGPIYVTQFNTRSCDPDANNDFTKTCHCTDASFMYNQNFVVPRVKGHYSANEQLYDDWRASANTQRVLDETKHIWGEFFRTGLFPEGTLQDINQLDFPVVNTIDESTEIVHQEKTFEDECSALDNVLGDNYLNRNWEEIGENFQWTPKCQNNEFGNLPADYDVTISTTKSGWTCQNWDSQSPHEHSRTPENYPFRGLVGHNYCRNPDEEDDGSWCYTANPDQRWEYCSCT